LSAKAKGLLIAIPLFVLLLLILAHYFPVPMPESRQIKSEIRIPRGATIEQIADSLIKKRLINDKKLFVFWVVSLGYEKRIKAGIFRIPFGLNYVQLTKYLSSAKSQPMRVTLIEGWSNRQIIARLAKKLELDSLKLDSLCRNVGFIRSLHVKAENLRGYLLPDTYTFPYGITEKQVLSFLVGRALALFRSGSAEQALHNLKLSIHQVLTLASIVEGEAMRNEERPLIASVYLNRLRKRIRLQADPTIQFLLDGKPRRLLYKDLKIKSPYNTYLHYGLPPGPINNPGKASIKAVLYPAASNYLYFVAKGDGSHIFCRNAAEHSKAKVAFNRLRRRLSGNKNRKK